MTPLSLSTRRFFLTLALGLAAFTLLPTLAHAQTALAPDLSITREGKTAVYVSSPSVVTLTVTNHGTAPAPSVNFSYAPGTPVVTPGTAGYVCGSIMKGHSGRDGGYTKVGTACTQSPAVPLAPGASIVVQFNVTYPTGAFGESWTVNAGSGVVQLDLVSHIATATVLSSLPAIPSAPTITSITQSGDSLVVNWSAPTTAGDAVSSSTVTAIPTTASLATLVGTSTGPATTASIAGVLSSTTYSVSVACKDAAGTGLSSAPVTFTTHAAATPPQAPTGVHTWWNGYTLMVAWTASVAGDSAVDDYQVSIKSTEGGKSHPVDAGLSTEVGIPIPDPTRSNWKVTVRAHNAAGWGPQSAPVIAAGL